MKSNLKIAINMLLERSQEVSPQFKESLFDKLKELIPAILTLHLPVVILLLIVRLQDKSLVEKLLRDPAALADYAWYWGALSNVGVLFWCIAATTCLFSYAVFLKTNTNKRFQAFLLVSGLLNVILLLDDLFLLHEKVIPIYLGISEKTVYLAYAILVPLYLLKYRKIILRQTNFFFLLLALCCFATTIMIDRYLLPVPQIWIEIIDRSLLEDGLKLLGILSWSAYFINICVKQFQQAIAFTPRSS